MKCIYYLAPTLSSADRVSRDLHSARANGCYVHVIAKDERELDTRRLPSANWFETLDLVRDGVIGAAIGCLAGGVGIGLLHGFQPFGPDVPGAVYLELLAAATLFGAWEGGLFGIASENLKLRRFHARIESGEALILVYVRQHREAAVRSIMRQAHPEATLAGVDPHFINPFCSVKPVGH